MKPDWRLTGFLKKSEVKSLSNLDRSEFPNTIRITNPISGKRVTLKASKRANDYELIEYGSQARFHYSDDDISIIILMQ